MPRITKISQQKNKNRVNIYLDYKFGFGLDLENFLKHNLKVGQELTEDEIEKVKAKGDLAKLSEKLLQFAYARPRSRWEIENWFYRKKVGERFRSKLIKKLKKLELIDDQKFAEWWIRQRTEFRPRSIQELTSELVKKKVDKSVINKALENAELDEVSLARRMLEKQKHKWEEIENDKQRFQKMSQYLARKGYGWDVIKKAISID